MLIINKTISDPLKEGKFWIENGILFCKLNHVNCFLTIDQVNSYLKELEEITQGKPMPMVIDVRKFVGNFSPDAAKAFADSSISKKYILTQAFVADTLNAKLLIGFYGRLYGNNSNIKIFNQIDLASAYCEEFKNNIYGVRG